MALLAPIFETVTPVRFIGSNATVLSVPVNLQFALFASCELRKLLFVVEVEHTHLYTSDLISAERMDRAAQLFQQRRHDVFAGCGDSAADYYQPVDKRYGLGHGTSCDFAHLGKGRTGCLRVAFAFALGDLEYLPGFERMVFVG